MPLIKELFKNINVINKNFFIYILLKKDNNYDKIVNYTLYLNIYLNIDL